MPKVFSIYLVYPINGNHYCKNKNPWALIGFLFLRNLRIQNINASLRSEGACLSKHTNPEDTLFKKWKENYSKRIKVQLWNDEVSKNQRFMPDSQKAKFSVGHTRGSAGRYRLLQATAQINTDRKEKAFQRQLQIHSSGIRRQEWNLINKHLSKSNTWFLKKHLKKTQMLFDWG